MRIIPKHAPTLRRGPLPLGPYIAARSLVIPQGRGGALKIDRGDVFSFDGDEPSVDRNLDRLLREGAIQFYKKPPEAMTEVR